MMALGTARHTLLLMVKTEGENAGGEDDACLG